MLKTSCKILLGIALFSMSIALQAHGSTAPEIIKPYQMSQYDEVIDNIYQQLPAKSAHDIQTRLDTISAQFLGKPYVLDSLGEGAKAEFDQGPVYRTDAFDCQTYVETVLALVQANDLTQMQRNILKVRYQHDKALFGERNHFVSVDWNRVNQKNGYIEDVTKSLFPREYKTARTVIDQPNWYKKLSPARLQRFEEPSPSQLNALMQSMHALATNAKVKIAALNYVPLDALFDAQAKPRMALFDRIPNGSIIEIVRPNWDLRKVIGTHLDVSHLGFAIRKNGVLMFREASSEEHKVIDIPLTEYLAHYLSSSTVKGIHIEKVTSKK